MMAVYIGNHYDCGDDDDDDSDDNSYDKIACEC